MSQCCKDAVTKVKAPMDIVCLILNIFVPGIGSIISGVANEEGKTNTNAIVFGLLQFFLSWTLVCWIWSIMHGVWIYQKAQGKEI